MKRCMFVDDLSVIRKVAERILGNSDLAVVELPSAAWLRAHDMPDIIVVDGVLPDMSAVEVIRCVRAIEALVRPKVVVCLIE